MNQKMLFLNLLDLVIIINAMECHVTNSTHDAAAADDDGTICGEGFPLSDDLTVAGSFCTCSIDPAFRVTVTIKRVGIPYMPLRGNAS